jgi:choline kinase
MNNTKIGCYILSYDITKGMKSVGPKGLLRSKKNKELINCQINSIKDDMTEINVVVGFGSDKLKKKIHSFEKINIIQNDLYETTNQGYALELILQDYISKKYCGCLIINDGILISNSVKEILLNKMDLQLPKIVYVCSESKKDIFNISFSLSNSNYVQHMFFNLTNNLWTETVYIDHQSLTRIQSIYNKNMRNMFLFEILNKSIDIGINYRPIKIKNSQILKINGIKDSNRIKESI